MPRYFFDLHDGEHYHDHQGVLLPDLRAAREEAARALADAARDELPNDGNERSIEVKVRDEDGNAVLQVTMNFLVRPPI